MEYLEIWQRIPNKKTWAIWYFFTLKEIFGDKTWRPTKFDLVALREYSKKGIHKFWRLFRVEKIMQISKYQYL